jgi:zinc protease
MSGRSLFAMSAALMLLGCGATPQSTAPALNAIPQLKYDKYQLPNGLEVILVEDHRLPLVAVNLWYHVGPANERPGRTGFAHLFEHMMFQGSRHVGNDRHFSLLEAAGASDINGTTDFDRTNYFETLPSNQLELALWIESDRMGYLLDTLDQEKLTGQIDVVRNERRQSTENSPYGLAQEAVFHNLFPQAHPYHADVMGSHADIESAKLEDVRQFFSEYYRPNNASLAIVGDIDKVKVRGLIEKYFGPLAGGAPLPRATVVTPPITAERRVTVTDKVELPRVFMAWLTPAIYQPGDADADLLGVVLGGGKSSRLYKKLVYELRIAQDVDASQQSLALGSMFSIDATAKPGVSLQTLEKAIDEELEAVRREGPTAAELERARNTIESGIIRGLETLGGFGGVADRLNQYNHYLRDPGYLAADIERYRRATPGSVRTLAQSLTANSRVVVEAVAGDKVIDDVPRTQPKTRRAAPIRYAADDWRVTPPVAAAASTLALPTPQRFTLTNGLNVYLLEQHQLPVLAASLFVLRGSEANPPAQPGLSAFTADMLDEGTATRSTLQIAEAAAQIGATLGTASSSDSSSASISVLRKDAEAAFDLLADVTLRPAFAAAEVERVRSQRLTALLQQRDNPDVLAARVMARALYGDAHPYGSLELGTEASLRAISEADLRGFWQAGFAPGNAALVVAGDITAADLRALADRHFGQWTGTAAAVQLPAPLTVAARRILVVDKPGSPQTALRIGSVGVPRATPDFLPLEIMNTTLGGLFSSRINMNLREQHGYAYGAGSYFAYRRGPGPFAITSEVRTDATAQSVSEVLKEVQRMRRERVSGEELNLARDAYARSLPADFETSRSAVGSIAELYIYGLPLNYYATLPASIDQVTGADVQRVAVQHLDPDTMTVVAVGDRAKIMPALIKLKAGKVELRDTEGAPAK